MNVHEAPNGAFFYDMNGIPEKLAIKLVSIIVDKYENSYILDVK